MRQTLWFCSRARMSAPHRSQQMHAQVTSQRRMLLLEVPPRQVVARTCSRAATRTALGTRLQGPPLALLDRGTALLATVRDGGSFIR